jgi:hypothetical protein
MPWFTIQQTPTCINLFPSCQWKGTEACFHHLSVINGRPKKGNEVVLGGKAFHIALLFSNVLPTTLIAASGLCTDENYKSLLVWQSFTENSYTEVAAARLGCFISIQNTPQSWKYQAPSFFKLNAVSHVTAAYIYTPSTLNWFVHSFTTAHDRILATDTNPTQKSRFVVNKIIT